MAKTLSTNYLDQQYHRFIDELARGGIHTANTLIVLNGSSTSNLEAILRDITAATGKNIRKSNKAIETESNLSKIFSEADNKSFILLFDEVDALIGKRTEVKDANDRYANIEVNFLLQRIENYRGIAILATHMKLSLGSRLMPKVNVIIQFPPFLTFFRKVLAGRALGGFT